MLPVLGLVKSVLDDTGLEVCLKKINEMRSFNFDQSLFFQIVGKNDVFNDVGIKTFEISA